MAGLPKKANVGVPGKSVTINPATYFLGRRMEDRGILRRGQALMLAATLPGTKPPRGKMKGTKK